VSWGRKKDGEKVEKGGSIKRDETASCVYNSSCFRHYTPKVGGSKGKRKMGILQQEAEQGVKNSRRAQKGKRERYSKRGEVPVHLDGRGENQRGIQHGDKQMTAKRYIEEKKISVNKEKNFSVEIERLNSLIGGAGNFQRKARGSRFLSSQDSEIA